MPAVSRLTPAAIKARKNTDPLVCLTAYTTPMAKRFDPHVDLLLVGDSVGMVLYGMDSTVPVTLDMMIAHTRAVLRGTERACVVADLPFGSYQASPAQAFESAARLLKEGGAQAVKLEGGQEMAETVAFLTARGIPVMGHIGLLPQSVNQSGYKAKGRADNEEKRLIADAKALSDAGAFALVIEATMEPLSRQITEQCPIPTIGIGASPDCNGQILVSDDMLGLFSNFTPRFVKHYASLGDEIDKAVAAYADDVRTKRFPTLKHCFLPDS